MTQIWVENSKCTKNTFKSRWGPRYICLIFKKVNQGRTYLDLDGGTVHIQSQNLLRFLEPNGLRFKRHLTPKGLDCQSEGVTWLAIRILSIWWPDFHILSILPSSDLILLQAGCKCNNQET